MKREIQTYLQRWIVAGFFLLAAQSARSQRLDLFFDDGTDKLGAWFEGSGSGTFTTNGESVTFKGTVRATINDQAFNGTLALYEPGDSLDISDTIQVVVTPRSPINTQTTIEVFFTSDSESPLQKNPAAIPGRETGKWQDVSGKFTLPSGVHISVRSDVPDLAPTLTLLAVSCLVLVASRGRYAPKPLCRAPESCSFP